LSKPKRLRSPREQLVYHVQELERLEEAKADAAEEFKTAMQAAKAEGFDGDTLRVVLRLRKMSASQRSERRALEAIYLAALGMLEGDPLPDEARRRLDGASQPPLPPPSEPEPAPDAPTPDDDAPPSPVAEQPEQAPLIVKDPAEARQEGADAAAAGKRIYDNPYRAGDPCRAAWDEGWCGQQKSHGMETPAAFRRRSEKPPKDDGRPRRQGRRRRRERRGVNGRPTPQRGPRAPLAHR
jgi:uncharacterized protein (UPF0335 family)